MPPFLRLLRSFCVSVLLLTSAAQAADSFYLKDGDRVVFYGDSITGQLLYTTFAETFVVTRFPKMNVEFVHSGWGGDRVNGGGGGNIDTRLERDVFTYRPTVMTVMLGMNDASYKAFDETVFNTFHTGLLSIVQKTQEKLPGIRMTLIQPSPFDDVTREPKFPGGYNNVLVRYGEGVKEIAVNNHQASVDFNGPIVAMLAKAKASDAQLATRIIGDRIHPGPAGHLIMSGELLKVWNAPAIVGSVEIDAKTKRVIRSVKTEATGLKVGSSLIEWTQLDESLPMPIDLKNPETALAVKSSDFIETLNQQPLRVTGLTSASYKLFIDDNLIGTFSSSELADSINLAMLATPMAAQAALVHKLTLDRANLHNTRWRTFQVPYASNTNPEIKSRLQSAITALDTANREVAAMQRAAAKPLSHQFKLVALSTEDVALLGREITAIPEDFGPNLALNKSWISSDPNTHGWNTGLTDGSWASGMNTTFATNDENKFPKTVTVDLGATILIDRIAIGVPSFGSTKTIEVAISDDNTGFRTIGSYSFSIRKEEKRLFTFAPSKARYIRLTYSDHHPDSITYPPLFVFTTDVQVFGPTTR